LLESQHGGFLEYQHRFIEPGWVRTAPTEWVDDVKRILPESKEVPIVFYEHEDKLIVVTDLGTVLCKSHAGSWSCLSQGHPVVLGGTPH